MQVNAEVLTSTTSRNKKVNIITELDNTDGSTVQAASINRGSSFEKRSIGPLVITIVNKVASQIEITKDQCTLLESLLWPFLARCSKRETFINPRNMEKLIQSLLITATRIKQHTDKYNKEQTFIKYWLDHYMCQVFEDHQRPLKEDWITENLFSGFLKRFVARAIAKRDLAFIYSLNKGSKRMWPTLSNYRKIQAFEKHRERLSTDHGTIPKDLRSILTVTSLEVFKNINSSPTEKTIFPTKLVPSRAACLESSRENGGTLSKFAPFDICGVLEGEVSKKIGVLRSTQLSFSKWTRDTYDKAYQRAYKYMNFNLKAVAVPEPSKFRMITKGSGFLYTALQPLQGLMLDSWKNHPSSTMRDEDLTKKINKINKNCQVLEKWCSVDYEAATDLVKKDATLAAFTPLKDVPDYEIALRALTGSGKISYPAVNLPNDFNPEECVRVPEASVIDGQLMGHPLSFPLLCVLNLSVLRCAVVRYISRSRDMWQQCQREFKGQLMLRNVLVNGDDMLFKCDSDFYEIFVETAKDMGFKLSVGKNYLSTDMCMINSQVFKFNVASSSMIRQGYLNQKFLVDTNDPNSNPVQVSKDLNRMVNLCPWTECIIPAIFLSRWQYNPIVDRGYEVKPNWYLPIHLGGYGVDPKFAPKSNKVTPTQRKLARYFMKDSTRQLFIREPELNKNIKHLTNKLVKDGLLRYQITDPYRPLNKNETEDADPWLARFSLMYDMSNSEEVPSQRFFRPSFINLRKIRPFTLDKIDRLREIKLISVHSAPCPPLAPITTHRPIVKFLQLAKCLPFPKGF